MSDLVKHKFVKEFKEWAKGKTLDEIAEKAYEAVSVCYDMITEDMLKKVYKAFVAPVMDKKP